ncbi:MAG: stage II sporulation protein E [Sphingobacteriia bacterium]|nr:stage II sporulation protein E [Sphingobacteriia bacterium]HPE35342.1 SpoIIE family protein phosphatase [Bacteroidales bacterium]HPR58789.1 SpoIIE family protein phosphatase [Bacteroidales bacterium]
MNKDFYIELNCQQRNHEGERICGDVFIHRRVKEENRIIAVLSDGMGHGVKANMLATLTATMAMSFTQEHKDFGKIAEIIMKTLPVCSVRKISYATFTIVDIELGGVVNILEYDNPETFIIRNNEVYEPGWQCILLSAEKNRGKELRSCSFIPEKEDRIVFCSDGVTQSGMGSDNLPFGWERERMVEFVLNETRNNKFVSAQELSDRVVKRAIQNDNFLPKDDTSCAVIYFRNPRKLLICTGPPFENENDKVYADKVAEFEGKKVLCGATTGDIIAREWGKEIQDTFDFIDPDLPPVSYMEGVDLITEGILTLTKVGNILKDYNQNTIPDKGPAGLIVNLILQSDEIDFIVGTRINIAHQDPSLPVELEIRRTVVKRIAAILEEKFLKEVRIEFI